MVSLRKKIHEYFSPPPHTNLFVDTTSWRSTCIFFFFFRFQYPYWYSKWNIKFSVNALHGNWKYSSDTRWIHRSVINQYRDTERNRSAFIIYICHTLAHKYPAACHYFLFHSMIRDQPNKRVYLHHWFSNHRNNHGWLLFTLLWKI